ncbi:cation:proton antiporter regulatory subunit [Biformimicrobium ophioploci]|uniref:cation:proton antiporter regulatory subunit n=1 Tax=Biformimicrobium ophioploci TaxID=3036711 RepID=UPI003D9FE263
MPEGSNFVGKTILETQLQEQDINVLTLYRGSKVIPNPKKGRVLEAEDKLLCFGKMESMRGMIPAKTRRRRSPAIMELPEDLPEGNHPDEEAQG